MRFASTAFALAACVMCLPAHAAGIPDEPFARDMITCAFKHVTFAFGPGDAAVAENAASEARAYLDAAAEASSQGFVETESEVLKPQAQEAVFAAMGEAKDVSGIVGAWKATKATCDGQLASFRAAQQR